MKPFVILVPLLAAATLLPQAVAATQAGVTAITIDYPAAGTIFPPEFPAPTFLWRDADENAKVWRIDMEFSDGSTHKQAISPGEPMKVGTIDERCIGAAPPELTKEQAAAHTWTPDAETWSVFKLHSVKGKAKITITGFRDRSSTQPVSRGQVNLETSNDAVGAPIFYRDVPLIPSPTEKGVIKPLPSFAIGLIQWRLRNVGERESRTLMTGLPTCVNCHSFSLDGKTLGLDVDGPQNDKGLYALVPVRKETSIRNEDVIRWSSFARRTGRQDAAAGFHVAGVAGRPLCCDVDQRSRRTERQGGGGPGR